MNSNYHLKTYNQDSAGCLHPNKYLNRFMKYADRYMLCFINVFDDNRSIEDNVMRQERLKKQLDDYGFGWITTIGHWGKKAEDEKTGTNNGETFVVINCYDNNPITFMQFIEFMAAACTEYKQKSILITVPPAILKLAPDIKIPKIKDPWDNTLLPGHVYCYNKSIYSLPEDKGLLSTSCDEQWEYFETPSPIIIKPSTIKENTSIYNLSGLVFTESSFKKAHMGKSYRTYFSVALNIKYWTNIYSKFFKESFKEQENPGKKELT